MEIPEVDEQELGEYWFDAGYDCLCGAREQSCPPEDISDNVLLYGLEYSGVVVGADPYTITPLGDEIKLFIWRKLAGKKGKGVPYEHVYLATYTGVTPFTITVSKGVAKESGGMSKPAVPPASSSTWGQVKDQAK